MESLGIAKGMDDQAAARFYKMEGNTMKKWMQLLSVLLILALLFCGCGFQDVPAGDSNLPNQDGEGNQVWQEGFWFSQIPGVEVQHGEDYVISWADPGMEAHVRFLLDRPEGDILHSDVWDIRMLTLSESIYGIADRMMIDAEGKELGFDNTFGDSTWRKTKENRDLPWVESLQDLRHFDSLQIFSLQDDALKHREVDLSGLTDCPNLMVLALGDVQADALDVVAGCTSLRVLELTNMDLNHLETLGDLPHLEYLWLTGSGCVESDALADLSGVKVLRLNGLQNVSLEMLSGWKELYALDLTDCSVVGLEPLTELNLAYLDLHLSESKEDLRGDLDWTPLTKMTSLTYLNLAGNQKVDAALCQDILNVNSGLRYLDVSSTQASGVLKLEGEGTVLVG